MADDIDIEEHDVMDNPAIKSMFPDLSVVKHEIMDYDEESPRKRATISPKISMDVHPDSTTGVQDLPATPDSKVDCSPVVSSTQVDNQETNDKAISTDETPAAPPEKATDTLKQNNSFLNKIILGTKPPKQDITEDESVNNKLAEPEAVNCVQATEIVQSPDAEQSTTQLDDNVRDDDSNVDDYLELADDEKNKCLSAKVLLKDLSGHLSKSKTFCSQCHILFPTVDSYDDHKMSVHSHLVTSDNIEDKKQVDPVKNLQPPTKATTAYVYQNKRTNCFSCHLCNCSLTRIGNLAIHYRKKHQCTMPQVVYKDGVIRRRKSKKTTGLVTKLPVQMTNTASVTPANTKSVLPAKTPPVAAKSVGDTNASNLCGHCNKEFPTKQDLINHLYDILKPTPFACVKCPLKFTTKKELDSHAGIHSVNKTQVNMVPNKDEATAAVARTNKYLRCQFCSCYVNNKNKKCLDQHMNLYHKQQPALSYLNTIFEPQCPLCDLKQDTPKDYNNHIFNNHKKNHHKMTNKPIVCSKTIKNIRIFCCNVCFKKFPTFNMAYRHSLQKHKSMKLPIHNKIKKITAVQHINSTNPPIPRSILYKCKVCLMHNLTFTAAFGHAGQCTTHNTHSYECSKCSNTFKESNRMLHEKQHLFSDEFKVIVVEHDKEMYKRVLCNCPKCSVHYSDGKFWVHYKECGRGPPNSFYCEQCDILIDSNLKASHLQSHETYDPKDFIIVDFDVIDDNTNQKIETEIITNRIVKKSGGAIKRKRADISGGSSDESQPKKKGKKEEMFFLRYCETCSCYLSCNYQNKKLYHINKHCRQCTICICKLCGLTFTAKAFKKHEELHKQYKNLTINDFQFSKLTSDDKIDPPMPKFKVCKECDLHHKLLVYVKHKCETDVRKTCKQCNKDFNPLAYKLHLPFHFYKDKHKTITTVVTPKPKVQKQKKYILYQCSECDAMVSENNLQSHRNPKYDCSSVKDVYKVCRDCGYLMSGKDYRDHVLSHETDPNFNRSNFTIKSLNKDKLPEINSIQNIQPEEESTEIEPVKPTDNTDENNTSKNSFVFHQCRNCELNIRHLLNVGRHNCAPLGYRKKCDECGLKFLMSNIARHKHEHLMNPDFKLENISIIPFGEKLIIDEQNIHKVYANKRINAGIEINDESSIGDNTSFGGSDVEAGQRSTRRSIRQAVKRKSQPGGSVVGDDDNLSDTSSRSSRKFDKSNTVDTASKRSLYQCIKCKLNYYDESFVLDHICDTTAPYKCLLCMFTFDKHGYVQHLKLHSLDKEFSRNSVDIVPFGFEASSVGSTEVENENNFEDQVDIEIYRCDCGLNFLSISDIETHLKICNSKIKVAKQECSKCGLVFTAHVLFTHIMTHHGSKLNHNYKIIEMSNGARKNANEGNKEETGFKNDKMDEENSNFHETNIDEEEMQDDQHSLPGVTKDSEPSNPSALAKQEDFSMPEEHLMKLERFRKNRNVIFKCRECNIHYMLEKTIYQHLKSFHIVLKSTKRCQLCGLPFCVKSLFLHNKIHHEQLNLRVNQFDIREYPCISDKEEVKFDGKINKYNVSEDAFKEIIQNKLSRKIYKCIPCNLHFLTKCALDSHVNVQNHAFAARVEKCPECSLPFVFSSLPRHKEVHHDKMSCKLEDFIIVTDVSPSMPMGKKKPKEDANEPKLYKCKPCDNHFITQDRCYKHIAFDHEPIPKSNLISCGYCGLKFLKPSLLKHKKLHHIDNSYTLKDLIIEEYQPMNTGVTNASDPTGPKIKTYIAADRAVVNDSHEISDGENDTGDKDKPGCSKEVIKTRDILQNVSSLDEELHLKYDDDDEDFNNTEDNKAPEGDDIFDDNRNIDMDIDDTVIGLNNV